MNRRQAVALLTSIPGLAAISRADLKPDDVLVVEVDGLISLDMAERIRAAMAQVWPNHKVAIFSDGMKLKVMRSEKGDA